MLLTVHRLFFVLVVEHWSFPARLMRAKPAPDINHAAISMLSAVKRLLTSFDVKVRLLVAVVM